jgi:hypothetical protein
LLQLETIESLGMTASNYVPVQTSTRCAATRYSLDCIAGQLCKILPTELKCRVQSWVYCSRGETALKCTTTGNANPVGHTCDNEQPNSMNFMHELELNENT